MKPDNRKQVRAAKAKAKAAAAAAAAAAATVHPATDDGATPDGESKPKGKRAQPKEKKKDTKPQQVRNPRTHASVIRLLVLINILTHTSD